MTYYEKQMAINTLISQINAKHAEKMDYLNKAKRYIDNSKKALTVANSLNTLSSTVQNVGSSSTKMANIINDNIININNANFINNVKKLSNCCETISSSIDFSGPSGSFSAISSAYQEEAKKCKEKADSAQTELENLQSNLSYVQSIIPTA